MSKLINVDNVLREEFGKLPYNYWDFVGSDTKELTHGLHNYPAIMIYPISRNIISIVKKYQKINTLLDPFMGSGTVLVEGQLSGFRKVYGTDLNPLSVLMSKVKTTVLNDNCFNDQLRQLNENITNKYSKMNNLLKTINEYIDSINIDITVKEGWGVDAYNILTEFFQKNNVTLNIPNFKNMGYWFKPKVIIELQLIKEAISDIEDNDYKNFFLICYSEVVRYVSNTRNSEFKLYRMPADKILKYDYDVKEYFNKVLLRNIDKIRQFAEKTNSNSEVHISFEDSRELESIPDNSIDLMITSPPYGDSRTTVAYGQFSRPSLWWLDLDYIQQNLLHKLDNDLLGGKKVGKEFEYTLSSHTLQNSMKKILEADITRARDVYSFYVDLDKALMSITKKMKINSYQFWVVGNRTVKKEKLLTDRIIVELGKKYGLVEVYDIPRNIPNKVMPSKNSPTNEVGKTVSTMTNEHIVILRKNKDVFI